MKNLKKVLMLVLVLAMVIGVMAGASATFTDDADINYKEAVEVLSATGVINGYEDGSFKPAGTVTRGEMAKMAAVILNKGQDIGALYASACPFTDAASNWAAGYIAYCYSQGLVNGRNATTFDPNGNVTGVEAAKMLLCALGFDVSAEGFTGSAWSNNVVAAANLEYVFLFENLDSVNLNTPLTREAAAQMMLNALKASMVAYSTTGTSISIGDTTISTGATRDFVSQGTYARFTIGATSATDPYLNLCEKLFPELKYASQADEFNRPGHGWTFKGEDVGIFAEPVSYTFNKAMTYGGMYTALGKVNFAAPGAYYRIVGVYVDGVDETTTYQTNFTNNIVSGKSNLFPLTDDGVQLEVYVVENGNFYDYYFVYVNTYVGYVSAWEEADVDSDGDVSIPEYVVVTPIVGAPRPAGLASWANPDADTGILVAGAVPTTAFKDADRINKTVVTYTAGEVTDGTGDYRITSIAAAQSVKGTLVSYTGNESAVIGSTTYNLSVMGEFSRLALSNLDTDVTAYLDSFGNIIYVDAVAGVDSYAYVVAAGAYTGVLGATGTGDDGYGATLVFADGTKKTVDCYADYAAMNDKIITYYVDGNNLYHLIAGSAAMMNDATNTLTDAVVTSGTSEVIFTEKNGTVDRKYATAATTFVVENIDTQGVKTYTSYTGIKNVPSIASAVAYAYEVSTVNASQLAVVYIFDATAGYSYNNIGLLIKSTSESRSVDGTYGTYYTVNSVLNGTIASVKIDQTTYAGLTNGLNLIAGYRTDANGVITAIDPVLNATAFKDGKVAFNAAAGFEAAANGVVELGGKTWAYDSNVVVYTYSAGNAKLASATVETLTRIATAAEALNPTNNNSLGYCFYTVDEDGLLTGIYAIIR